MISADELRQLRIFRDASDAAVARLASVMRERLCVDGEVILKEGDTGAGLHLIASGAAVVRKNIDAGTTKDVAHLTVGQFFGEMSLVEKMPASAEVAAEGDTRLFILDSKDFDALMTRSPNEAVAHLTTLLSGLSSRLRQTTRELVTLFQVARNLSVIESPEKLATVVTGILSGMMGESITIGLYLWNPFNDEYARAARMGGRSALLPDLIEKADIGALKMPPGDLVLSRCDLEGKPQALFVYFTDLPQVFEPGDRQVMETVSSVLALAFHTARVREDEQVRRDYEAKKQNFG
jgi:CRP/FNR family transcriptional regulator, cyclic AMP receptor protein